MKLFELLSQNKYQGRGILLGATEKGLPVIAYFIMGRSQGSRSREFYMQGAELRIAHADADSLAHPELVLYRPMHILENSVIIANGDQSEEARIGLCAGKGLCDALAARRYEPDPPHFTPRITGVIDWDANQSVCGSIRYELSILKACECFEVGVCSEQSQYVAAPECVRQFFRYEASRGFGHIIHTYRGVRDSRLLPFWGEPLCVEIPSNIDELTRSIWQSLDSDNRVALFTRIGFNNSCEFRIVNQSAK